MKTLTVIFPSSPEVTFQIPGDYPVPPVGGDFYIKFEKFITDPDQWELVEPILANDSMTVQKIEGDKIYLYEGYIPGIEYPDDEEYISQFEAYWEKNPEFKPEF